MGLKKKKFWDQLMIPDGFINAWKEIQSEIKWQADDKVFV